MLLVHRALPRRAGEAGRSIARRRRPLLDALRARRELGEPPPCLHRNCTLWLQPRDAASWSPLLRLRLQPLAALHHGGRHDLRGHAGSGEILLFQRWQRWQRWQLHGSSPMHIRNIDTPSFFLLLWNSYRGKSPLSSRGQKFVYTPCVCSLLWIGEGAVF